MPTYEYACEKGHHFERVLAVADYQTPQTCECGVAGRRVISVPARGYVQKECNYDSPITGKPITSWKQRRDDLARNGCREYDPEMRTDYDRRVKRDAAELEKGVDSTVDALYESLPTRKREQLESELKSGADATIERGSVPRATIRSIE